MYTDSALESIRAEVERRIQQELPGILLAVGYKQHIKHGFKTGCDCSYCSLKRGFVHVHYPRMNTRFEQFRSMNRDLKR